MEPPASPDTDFPPTVSRAASVWPDSMPPTARPDASFPITRFDPMADERERVQSQAAAAFDVCHPALALRAVLFVQGVLAIVALGSATTVADWGARQAALAFGGVAGTLSWLVAMCALRRPLQHLAAPARLALVLGGGASAALLAWLPLWWAGLSGVSGGLRAVAVGLAGAAFAALAWAWLAQRWRMRQPADASARLAELQSRIQPHFLFNALNAALALVRADPARAEQVLEDLAQLFRVALADTGASVALAEEIDLARRYLAIEQVRYGARLQVRWDISADPRVAAARVPPLVLQPLVENAVRHGIEPSLSGGRVTVRATLQRGQVVVVVSNPVGSEPGHPGHGMALDNVRERLRLLHDVAAQCDVWRDPTPEGETFHARIVVPAP